MVEGSAKELPEETFIEAIEFAHENIRKIIVIQDELKAGRWQTQKVFQPPVR